MQHWLYPINPKSNYFLIDPETGEEMEVSVDNLHADIAKRRDVLDDWGLSSGFKSMAIDDLVWIYASAPVEAVVALAVAKNIYVGPDGGWHVDLLWDVDRSELLFSDPIPRSRLSSRPQAPSRPSAIGVRVLDEWLTAHPVGAPAGAPDAQPVSDEDARRRTLSSIYVRRGQQAFRSGLMAAYGGSCAITGCQDRAVLEAAHIQPYRGDHTNVLTNGLLLRSDIHTLFDLHLIALDDDMRVLVSSTLTDGGYRALQGRKLRPPKQKSLAPSKRALKSHRALLVP